MVSAALGASVAPFYEIAINLNVIIGFLISFGHALVTFFRRSRRFNAIIDGDRYW